MCPKCGHVNKDGWYICANCGSKRYESINVDMKNPAPDMRHREQEKYDVFKPSAYQKAWWFSIGLSFGAMVAAVAALIVQVLK